MSVLFGGTCSWVDLLPVPEEYLPIRSRQNYFLPDQRFIPFALVLSDGPRF